MSRLAAALAAVACVVACSPPSITCQQQTCSDANKTYQACSHTDGSVSYDFGGMTCTCPAGDAAKCQDCSSKVDAFCGAGGGAGGGGGGSGACTSTFSGGFTGTIDSCHVTINYVPANGAWVLGTGGGDIPNTPYTWNGLNLSVSGAPQVGTWDLAQTSSTDQVMPTSGSGPVWLAAHGTNGTFGAGTLKVTSLGAANTVGTTTIYESPHGTWTATMVDQNSGTHMADVAHAVTF